MNWKHGLALVVAFGLGGLVGHTIGERPVTVELVESQSPLDADSSTTSLTTAGGSSATDETGEEIEDSTTEPSDTDPLTLYVSPEGDDGGDGQTPESAFATLPRAVEAVQPGMTLFVMEGVHEVIGPGPTLIPLVREGTPDAWTRILGYGDERPVIVARGGALFEALGSYIEISGLELRGEGFDQQTSYGYGILAGDGHHFRFVGNKVSGFPVSGIGAVRTSHLYIADNIVFGNSNWGTEQGSGLGVFHATNYGFADDEFGYSDYFINNVVYGNENLVTSRFVQGTITDGNGIIIDNGDETGYLGRTLIANNVIYGNGGRGIWAFGSSRVDIFNNTTYGNVRTGAALNGARGEIASARGVDVRIVNNVAWNESDEAETYVLDGSDGLFVAANVAVVGPVFGYEGEGITQMGPLPGFVNPTASEGADFSLTQDSPLIDLGMAVDLPLEADFYGLPRLVGPAYDIGASEYQG